MTEPAQRTPEWHAKRVGRVTGSIVGAILGLSPYMTRADAMRSMVRAAIGEPSEFTGNVATEYGNAHEDGAIVEFQMETGLKVKPAPFLIHDDWLGASPDGFVSDGGLIEVKCPYGLRDADSPVPFKSIDDQPHYYAQIQVQLYVARTDYCHFWQWSKNGTRHEIVNRDQSWLDTNLPRLRQFHAEYLDEVANNADEHRGPKLPEIDTPDARRMMAEWDEIAEQLERLAERKADLLSDIVKAAGERSAYFGGRKVTLVQKKGTVSYAKAIKALCPKADLEPYRGKPSSYWQVR